MNDRAPHDTWEFDLNLPPTWPEEMQRLYWEARRGLAAGHLDPLHAFLVSGYQMPELLMHDLAQMIDRNSEHEFQIVTRGKRAGKTRAEKDADTFRRIQIGLYAEMLLRGAQRGEFEAAVEETMTAFPVKRATVTNALRYVRALLAENGSNHPPNMRSYFDLMCDTFLWGAGIDPPSGVEP